MKVTYAAAVILPLIALGTVLAARQHDQQEAAQVASDTAAVVASLVEHPALSDCATERYAEALRAAGVASFHLEPQDADCQFSQCFESPLRGAAQYRAPDGQPLRRAWFLSPPKMQIASPILGDAIPFALSIDGAKVRVFAPAALPLAASTADACAALGDAIAPILEA